jgi:hypothetical protein
MHKFAKYALIAAISPFAVVSLYTVNVIWRVGLAEADQFGRSTLIPVSLKPPAYKEPPTLQSYGNPTYTFERSTGKTITVHKQLINGFQHAYRSALVDYELGSRFADLLFRANEYAESYVFCRKTANSEDYSLDTRKDLANNSIGRAIGKQARRSNLTAEKAYQYILTQTVQAVDGGQVLPHFLDPRVAKLPTEAQYGCPGLYLTNPKL